MVNVFVEFDLGLRVYLCFSIFFSKTPHQNGTRSNRQAQELFIAPSVVV